MTDTLTAAATLPTIPIPTDLLTGDDRTLIALLRENDGPEDMRREAIAERARLAQDRALFGDRVAAALDEENGHYSRALDAIIERGELAQSIARARAR